MNFLCSDMSIMEKHLLHRKSDFVSFWSDQGCQTGYLEPEQHGDLHLNLH
jgi:hypothetical protein